MHTLGTHESLIVFLQMPSTGPHPQYQLRTLLWTSSKNKYFAFISPAQWKHFSKLLPRWYLVLFWVSSPCSWLSNGQTCLIVILKERKKNKRAQAVFLKSSPRAQAESDTTECESQGKEAVKKWVLFAMSPLTSPSSTIYFSQSEEGTGEHCGEVRKEYFCSM